MYKNIQILNIYLNNQSQKIKLGTLAIKDKKIYFEYDKEFLKTGIEISPYKLPLKSGLHICKDDTFEGLWGVFDDSLPDGWGRLLMDRHLIRLGVDMRSITPLDRLSNVGSFGMGALSYEPDSGEDSDVDEIVLDDLAQSSKEILEGSSEDLLDELYHLGGSSAGARPKVLVSLSKDLKYLKDSKKMLDDGFSHWIVKFASNLDHPDIGAIEYAYSLMAKEAGLEMSQTALLESKRGRYFAIKRFDRIGDKRVHMHSVAGMIHSDFRFPTLDYDDILALTLHLTKDMQEVKKVFRSASFNLFAHNRDDHAKNFSFLMDESGRWRFSPVYDLTFSNGPGGEHSTMYMGEGKNPTTNHLIKLAQKYDIKDATAIIQETKDAISLWSKFANGVDISSKISKQIEKEFKLNI